MRDGDFGYIPDTSKEDRVMEAYNCLKSENRITEQRLGDLLALIHRDGGHYQARYGTAQACKRAGEIIIEERTRLMEAHK